VIETAQGLASLIKPRDRTDLDLGDTFESYLRRWSADIGKPLIDLVRGANVTDTAIEVTLPAGVRATRADTYIGRLPNTVPGVIRWAPPTIEPAAPGAGQGGAVAECPADRPGSGAGGRGVADR
jgi:hypothetical protein